MSRNRLVDETSPYLLQHKDNPVHWYPWGDEAFAAARAEGKAILLSVGYAACHWCHVMAHESFEDPTIADLMNDLFINVKLDREERPDLDALYQGALQMMGEQGGWPLTIFLTPDGEPFWGGTYFPPQARWGRPGFPQVLRGIADAYRNRPADIRQTTESLRANLEHLAGSQAVRSPLTPAALDVVGQTVLRMIDPVHGGLQGAPKFPQPALFRFLWSGYLRGRSTLYRDAVVRTLEAMCQGGIYDHLGGGFARYSTDEVWLVPHFEKMLYDNAQLIELMTLVWLETRSPLLETRVAETIDWLLRDMRIPDPDCPDFAFAGTLDADSEGTEGAFYVWTEEEIDALLGADSPVFKEHYDVTGRGNWEGATILNRTANPGPLSSAVEARLAEARAILLRHRSGRVHPGRDDKVLTDWNAMAVAALARAGAAFDRPEWITAARSILRFLRRNLFVDGRLHHGWKDGRARHPAVLDDWAQLARAALALHEVDGDSGLLDLAASLVAEADRLHRDGASYLLASSEATDVLVRTRPTSDGATPSGNGVMAEVLARLHFLTGETRYRLAAERLITALASGSIERQVGQPTLLDAFDLLERAVQVLVIAGDTDSAAYRRAFHAAAHPFKLFQRFGPETDLPAGHPASGKRQVDGLPTAYVCVGSTCGLPITDPGRLSETLHRL